MLDSIIEKEIDEAERRIQERLNHELKEARKHISKKFITIVLTLQKLAARRAEELEAAKIHDLDPKDKTDRKTLGELISEKRELEESEKK